MADPDSLIVENPIQKIQAAREAWFWTDLLINIAATQPKGR
jgi:hypothetical protein